MPNMFVRYRIGFDAIWIKPFYHHYVKREEKNNRHGCANKRPSGKWNGVIIFLANKTHKCNIRRRSNDGSNSTKVARISNSEHDGKGEVCNISRLMIFFY